MFIIGQKLTFCLVFLFVWLVDCHIIIIIKMQSENRENERRQFAIMNTVIQVAMVILAITVLAHVTMNIRIIHIFESTKMLISQFSKMKFKQITIEIVTTYFIYILLSIILLICFFYVTQKILNSRILLLNSFQGHYSSRFLKPIILFLLFFYLTNLFITFQSRWQYTKFYNDFKEGQIGTQFMGFKEYHFLNHADETKRILTQLTSQANNQEEKALVQDVKNLVKKQDKNLSTFRSYVANYNLLFKITNIVYYFFAFVGSICLIVVFSINNCFFLSKTIQGQYGSIEQHQHEESSQQSLVSCPEQSTRHKFCSSCCIILISTILSALILVCFILGDIFVQLKIGHPYDNNIEQETVCSFHNEIGGFFINIDYQNQLSLAEQFHQLEKYLNKDAQKSQKSIEIVQELSRYLKIYINLCQILQPYYLIHKHLQSKLSQLFYRHFYAFIFIYWRYFQILSELKTDTQRS